MCSCSPGGCQNISAEVSTLGQRGLQRGEQAARAHHGKVLGTHTPVTCLTFICIFRLSSCEMFLGICLKY